jgi:cytochrome c biogenesis protein CcmG/thiol:disulfide interchange protein DsbE
VPLDPTPTGEFSQADHGPKAVGSSGPRLARLGRWLAIFLPAIALVWLLAYGFRTNPREIPSPLLGRPAAPFTLTLFDGGRFALAEHAGRVVMLNFWASWCVPCREEAPLLEATWRTYRDQGVLFIGVNVQDSEEAARDFLSEFRITYPNGPDPGGRIAIEYGVYGIPETFFIGRGGRILAKDIGAIGSGRLVASLDATLAGSVVRQRESPKGAYQPIR